MTKQFKLPLEFGVKFVNALLSGKYQQGQSKLLNNSGGYCCLGVAASICGVPDDLLRGADFVLDTNIVCNVSSYYKLLTEKADECNYPQELKYARTTTYTLAHALSSLNDHGQSFADIAKWIKENVLFYE